MRGLETIKRLRDQQRSADRDLYDAIEKYFPIGASISWKRGGYRQEGKVIRTYDERIKVRNNRTKKEFWIHIYDVLQ
ncbi:hypothetical protein [Candidatus Manganitrophus noduliformans]|uniref:Uncharacterized protein n=1 Tax=Candidatus Manganitrophus noduliformans TaxID=2606439 RepID=A0A7X6DMJ2_9BACT|nr:hypothetical protein [Candidatus Manganitrophus noduliformans]NKE69857.1 hypothetical protein [Candidatus Manganitrophus noduliformans]